LLASTLRQRAELISRQIFDQNPPDPRWPQLRKIAIQDLQQTLELKADQESAYRLLGRLYMLQRDDRQKAREALTKALELGVEGREDRAQTLLMRSGLQIEEEAKLADLNEALKLSENDAGIYRARAQVRASASNFTEALADLDKAIELEPKSAENYLLRGLTLVAAERPQEALADLDKAIELAPRSPLPSMQKARVLSTLKKWDEALAAINKAIEIQPNLAQTILLRATIYKELGKYSEALGDLDTILKMAPNSPQVLALHAQFSIQAGQMEKAITDLVGLLKFSPDNLPIKYQLGLLYTANKQPVEGLKQLSEVLSKDPEFTAAYRVRANTYLNIGKHAEAIADFEEANKREPDNSETLNNFAWVLATSPDDKLRDGKRAIELATKACELTDYKTPHILSTLAAAYAETGDFETAKKWSAKSIELEQGEIKEQLEKELESYQEGKPWREMQSMEEQAGEETDSDAVAEPGSKDSSSKDSGEKPGNDSAPPAAEEPAGQSTPATQTAEDGDKPDQGAEKSVGDDDADGDK